MANEIAKTDRYIAEYETDSGTEIKLSMANVRDLISTDKNVTDKEVMLFCALCKERKLNPFVKEAYLVKYGSNPAQLIVGKDYYAKTANRNPNYDGCECGITVITPSGTIERREGSMFLEKQETLIGGWCRVHRKDRAYPTFDEVSFDEYSTGKSMWKMPSQGGKPGTQIRKVAFVHAHREAFPEQFNGLYDAAEMGSYEDALDAKIQAEAEDAAEIREFEATDYVPLYEDEDKYVVYEEEMEAF